jgi:hypothetical protein
MSFPQGTPGFKNPAELIANKVVIEGASDGIFLYMGQGSASNPPFAYFCTGTTDPFGNTVVPDQLTINSGGSIVLNGSGYISINGSGLLAAGDVIAASIDCLDLTVESLDDLPGYPLTIGNTAADNEACQTLLNALIAAIS